MWGTQREPASGYSAPARPVGSETADARRGIRVRRRHCTRSRARSLEPGRPAVPSCKANDRRGRVVTLPPLPFGERVGERGLNLQELSQSLTAVILAAGHGTRMRSRIPKVLHPICGRPMLDYVLDAVTEAGAKDIKVIVNPHHAEVAAHLDERGIAPTFQREPKGTAHALQQIPENELKGKDVLVVNGDSPLITADTIRQVVHAHREKGAPATLASVEDPTRDDGRIIRTADGALWRIVERRDATPEIKAAVHEFNVGVYCFDGTQLTEALKEIKNDNNAGEYYLTDVFLHLEPVTVVKLVDPQEAMGAKDRVRLAAARAILQRRILEKLMLSGVTIIDPDSTFVEATVTIGQDTVIEPFTVLK